MYSKPSFEKTFKVTAIVPETWTCAYIWAWEDPSGTGAYTDLGWPGKELTKNEDGSYHIDDVPGFVNCIIIATKDGDNTPQTVDLKNLEAKDLTIKVTTQNAEGKYEAEVSYDGEPTPPDSNLGLIIGLSVAGVAVVAVVVIILLKKKKA